MNATQPIDVSPTTVNASMASSLIISVTTIAECTMRFFAFYATLIVLNTTIRGVGDLCIVQCSCLLDLLLDESKGVHL